MSLEAAMPPKGSPSVSLEHDKLPRHVAIIMDGNGRWARTRGWHRSLGHVEGTSRVKAIIDECRELGIKYLTLYCFSSENWGRPQEEIDVLMKLLKDYMLRERQELLEKNIRLTILGDITLVPPNTRAVLEESVEMLSKNDGYCLNLCISYGGRNEILQATRRFAQEVAEGKLRAEDITEEAFSKALYTSELPDPDLIIRTSGEKRISNFLLWQIAYSEIYVTDVLWPDFEPKHLHLALEDYQQRKRRYGLSDEAQLSAQRNSKK
jgi:undecaprenyl diphosphate synthase